MDIASWQCLSAQASGARLVAMASQIIKAEFAKAAHRAPGDIVPPFPRLD